MGNISFIRHRFLSNCWKLTDRIIKIFFSIFELSILFVTPLVFYHIRPVKGSLGRIGDTQKNLVNQIEIEVVLGVEKKETKVVKLQEKLYKEIINQSNIEVDRFQTEVKQTH